MKTKGDMEYLPIKSWDEVQNSIQKKLDEYNENNVQMHLVLFKQAIRHVCKIVRMLFQPGGNPLLIGVGGSGK